MKFLLFLAIALFANTTFAVEKIYQVKNPVEVKEESYLARSGSLPNGIEGLVWNRWTSKNFVVLSLNNDYAKYLNQHLELVKSWTLSRWGLLDIDYSVQCKFICVDDPALFDSLFRIKKTKIEIRRNELGVIKETVIFLLASDVPSHTVPSPITEVSLVEFAQRYNTNFAWWSHRGIAILNGPLDQIRLHITETKKSLTSDSPMFFSKNLLLTTKAQYDKFTDEKKRLFDNSAVLFCLMIRKEFGQDKFHHMLKDKGSEESIKKWIKFENYDEFDKSFKRYMTDLSNDVISNKTPNHYLQITEPEKD